MNVGSTFTGIGGLDLGLERAGMRVVWQCEQDAYGVRRLTPREYERLQGFPDDWTDGPDSRRYAALGDAVTVNVAEWIGRRIMGAA